MAAMPDVMHMHVGQLGGEKEKGSESHIENLYCFNNWYMIRQIITVQTIGQGNIKEIVHFFNFLMRVLLLY